MGLYPVAADAGQRLLDLFVEEPSQTVKGGVGAASPAAQEHFPSGFLEMERGSALRTRDGCFIHISFCFITLPQPLPSREGRRGCDLPSREGRRECDLLSRDGKSAGTP